MTTCVPGILYARMKGKWLQSQKTRFATEAEAEAYLERLRGIYGDDVLETRIDPSDYKPTHTWSFEHNKIVECHRTDSEDLRTQRHTWRK